MVLAARGPETIFRAMPRPKSLLASLFVIVCLCNMATSQPTPSTTRTISAKVKTPDLEATITVSDAPTVSKCPLTVTIRNVGTQPLVLYNFFEGAYCSKISLESPSKKPCPYTQLGAGVFGPFPPAGSILPSRISPGNVFTFTIPLEKFFQLEAGTWRLTFKLNIDNTAKDCGVELPQLEFTLKGIDKNGNGKP
jgi:hypothetical protein